MATDKASSSAKRTRKPKEVVKKEEPLLPSEASEISPEASESIAAEVTEEKPIEPAPVEPLDAPEKVINIFKKHLNTEEERKLKQLIRNEIEEKGILFVGTPLATSKNIYCIQHIRITGDIIDIYLV